MKHLNIALAALLFGVPAYAAQAPDTSFVTGPNFLQTPPSKVFVTPTGGTQQNLLDALSPQGLNLNGANASGANVTATGGSTARTTASRAAEVFNIMDGYGAVAGAKCDGTTDDSAAINATITYAKANALIIGATQAFRIQGPSNKTCLVQSPINMTGIRNYGASWDVNLTCNTGHTSACIDAVNSVAVEWWGNTWGSSANYSRTGLQLGSSDGVIGAGSHIDHMNISGYFALAPLLNVGSEVYTCQGCFDKNVFSDGTGYGAVFDGYDHFVLTSTFQTITLTPDTRITMGGTQLVGGSYYASGSGDSAPLWLGGVRAFKAIHTYAGAIINATNGVDLYTLASDGEGNNQVDLDLHVEHQPNLTTCFYIEGSDTTPLFQDFRWKDTQPQCSGSVFVAGAGVTKATFNSVDIDVTMFNPNPLIPLLDNPTLYSMNGKVALPLASWNEPLGFTGQFCSYSSSPVPFCTAYVPTGVLNRNPDFVIDQPHGGSARTTAAGGLVADGWRYQGGLSSGGTLSLQFGQTTAAPSGYTNSLFAKVLVAGSPGVGQNSRFESMIESSNISGLVQGSAGALPFTISFCAMSNLAGQYSQYTQNATRARSYVIPFTLAAANTWQCYVNRVAGETSGTWLTAPNTVGMWIGFTIGAASSFNTPGAGWQGGTYYNSAGDVAFAGTVSNQLWVTAVHVTPSPLNLPYAARRLSDELTLAQHYYRKSLNYNVLPNTSQGLIGATTMTLPYSFSSGLAATEAQVFSPPMFDNNGSTPPTITFYSPSAASAACYNTTLAAASGTAAAVNVGDGGFTVSCPLVSGDTLGNSVAVQWQVDSGF